MRHYLLTGAGFSRNWGCWLGNEVFEYLLGTDQVKDDPELAKLLWAHKTTEGFEGALGQLQEDCLRANDQAILSRYVNFLTALNLMFTEMNHGLAARPFEFQTQIEWTMSLFLSRFEAIFTLNQDLLLENFYHMHVSTISRRVGKNFNGAQMPGLVPRPPTYGGLRNPIKDIYDTGGPDTFKIDRHAQPYFKLHGSSNWFDHQSQNLMIMGTAKDRVISNYPLLHWYSDEFQARLSDPAARLMIIGYSFRDQHINKILEQAVYKGLKIFIVDPQGTDAIRQGDPSRGGSIPGPWPTGDTIASAVIGASRRALSEIFGSDRIEGAKVMKFFE